MADELEGQSPQADNAPATDAPQATQTPAPATEPELPPRWAGKSAAEIAKAHEELERRLGEQGRQLGEFKAKADEYESQLAYIRNLGQTPQTRQAQQPQQITDEFYYEKPIEATRQLAREEMQRELQSFRQSLRYEEGARAFPRTLADVKRSEPEIFGDPEIEEGVRKFVEFGVKNQGLDPMVQSDPTALVAIGNHLKYLKSKRNPHANPTAPVMTESPTAVRKQEPTRKAQQFSDWDKAFIRHFSNVPEVGFNSYDEAAKLLDEEEK